MEFNGQSGNYATIGNFERLIGKSRIKDVRRYASSLDGEEQKAV